MTVWLWIGLVSLVVYWSIFFYLLTRRRWDTPALLFGILHMLFASLLLVAPIRSLIDPDYIGLQLGLARFEGRWATLPATVFLAWGLASAWGMVAHGRGSWMEWIAVGDILFTLNLGGGFLLDLVRGELAEATIQAGEHFTLRGTIAALIPLLFFALPFVASAIWAARRAHSDGTPPPGAQGTRQERVESDEDTKGINDFRFSESRI